MTLKYETIVTGSFQENCFMVWDTDTMTGIFIDPGAEPEKLLASAKSKNVKIEGIFNTHGHIDHVGAVQGIVDALDVPFALHKKDLVVVNALGQQAALFGIGGNWQPPNVDVLLDNDSEIPVGNIRGKVLFTPGHTPGGVCFLFDGVVFAGDTLFAGSIGRSDLPGGNGALLMDSINDQLMTLNDSVKVMSGHGPASTIGKERKHNPFINMNGIF